MNKTYMKPNTSKQFGAIFSNLQNYSDWFPSFFGGLRLVKPTIIVGSNCMLEIKPPHYLVKGLGRTFEG